MLLAKGGGILRNSFEKNALIDMFWNLILHVVVRTVNKLP